MEHATTTKSPAGGRWVVVGIAVLGLTVLGYFTLNMPGMDHGVNSGTTMAGLDHDSDSGSMMTRMDMALAVGEFADRIAEPDAFVINVHGPAAGAIQGTDATIPYDQIAEDNRLPADRATPILLYCQTGRMSAMAAHDLMTAGYVDVVYLEGGTDAWEASGRTLT